MLYGLLTDLVVVVLSALSRSSPAADSWHGAGPGRCGYTCQPPPMR